MQHDHNLRPTRTKLGNLQYFSRWTKTSNPTDAYQVNPRPQISMLHKALYSFLCVQVLIFLSTGPKCAAQRQIWNLGMQGQQQYNNTTISSSIYGWSWSISRRYAVNTWGNWYPLSTYELWNSDEYPSSKQWHIWNESGYDWLNPSRVLRDIEAQEWVFQPKSDQEDL